jgi:hypothetical protein
LGVRFTKYNDKDGRFFIPDMIVQYDFVLFWFLPCIKNMRNNIF